MSLSAGIQTCARHGLSGGERTMLPVQLPEGALGGSCMISAGATSGLLLRMLPP